MSLSCCRLPVGTVASKLIHQRGPQIAVFLKSVDAQQLVAVILAHPLDFLLPLTGQTFGLGIFLLVFGPHGCGLFIDVIVQIPTRPSAQRANHE